MPTHRPDSVVHRAATLIANRVPEAFSDGPPRLPPRPFHLDEDFSSEEREHFIGLAEAVLAAAEEHARSLG
jgi:hypothetical protein